MSYAVVLKGGPPWGFRIQGGKEFNEPISVAKVCIFHLFEVASLMRFSIIFFSEVTNYLH